jgi:hypothetical protein
MKQEDAKFYRSMLYTGLFFSAAMISGAIALYELLTGNVGACDLFFGFGFSSGFCSMAFDSDLKKLGGID